MEWKEETIKINIAWKASIMKSFTVIKRLNQGRFSMMIKDENGDVLAHMNEQLNLWAGHCEDCFLIVGMSK